MPYVKSGTQNTYNVTGGLWHCPSSGLPDSARSYGISMGFTYDSDGRSPYNYRYLNEADIDKPAMTVFVGDAGNDGRLRRTFDYNGYYYHFVNQPPDSYASVGETPWRHQAGANYVWCDGHAKYMKGDIMFPHPPPPSTAYSSSNGAAY